MAREGEKNKDNIQVFPMVPIGVVIFAPDLFFFVS